MCISIVFFISIILTTITYAKAQTLNVNTTWAYQVDINEGMTGRFMVPNFVEKAPKELCKVEFKDGGVAGIGNIFTPNRTAERPSVSWKCNESCYYTLTMTNAEINYDGNIFNETQYWMVVNIPGCDINQGDEVIKYRSPTVVLEDEYYQYVVMIFKQPGKITPEFNTTLNEDQIRTSFKVKDFAWIHELGNPQAASLFYTFQPPDYDDFLKLQDHKNIQKHLSFWDNIKFS